MSVLPALPCEFSLFLMSLRPTAIAFSMPGLTVDFTASVLEDGG